MRSAASSIFDEGFEMEMEHEFSYHTGELGMTGDLWAEKSIFSLKYDLLRPYIPMRGCAQFTFAQALIAMNRVYYDTYNNGAGNILGDEYTDTLISFLELWLDDALADKPALRSEADRHFSIVAKKVRNKSDFRDRFGDDEYWDALNDKKFLISVEWLTCLVIDLAYMVAQRISDSVGKDVNLKAIPSIREMFKA